MKDLDFKMLINQRLCKLVDEVLYHYNPCQRDGDRCIEGKAWCCTATRFLTNSYKWFNDRPDCFFLGPDGCTFSNIECKVWLCDGAKQASPECYETLDLIEQIAHLHGLL